MSLAKYRKSWDDAYTLDPAIPLNVDIELASLCNLRCPYCFIPDPKFNQFIKQKSEDGGTLRRLMPRELACKIIDECGEIGVPALKFNWRGESTLHPDYARIVSYARSKHHRVFAGRTNTTASFVYEPDFLEILANTNANCQDRAIDGLMACTKVMVSLDSMVPDTYAQMRVGGNLDRAKEVISELVRREHPNLWVRRVLTKLNHKEPFLDQVKERWGDKIHVSQHHCFDRNASQSHEQSGCDHDDKRTSRRYCGYPSQRLVISSTGKVYPCCIDLHETMPVGDIHKQTIREIWEGEAISSLRKILRNNTDTQRWSETCRNCESWMSYDKPQRNFVQDVEMVEEKAYG